jgi:hypothetical protein
MGMRNYPETLQLYRTRVSPRREVGRGALRAFDKAVNEAAGAADAGSMEIECREVVGVAMRRDREAEHSRSLGCLQSFPSRLRSPIQ